METYISIKMRKMGDILNKITVGQIAITAFAAGLMEWLTTNEIVFWITLVTITITLLLAIRKAFIVLRKDILFAIDFIKQKRN